MEALEMLPHRRGGIRESTVGERVRGQQMTELVVNVGLRDRHDREEGQPHGEGRHDDAQDC